MFDCQTHRLRKSSTWPAWRWCRLRISADLELLNYIWCKLFGKSLRQLKKSDVWAIPSWWVFTLSKTHSLRFPTVIAWYRGHVCQSVRNGVEKLKWSGFRSLLARYHKTRNRLHRSVGQFRVTWMNGWTMIKFSFCLIQRQCSIP